MTCAMIGGRCVLASVRQTVQQCEMLIRLWCASGNALVDHRAWWITFRSWWNTVGAVWWTTNLKWLVAHTGGAPHI